MVDGARLPPNASGLLPKLVELTKMVTEQVRQLAKEEDEKLADMRSYDVMLPYNQSMTLGKTNIDVDRIAVGLPCGSEGLLLMYARWTKLDRHLYNERKGGCDLTQFLMFMIHASMICCTTPILIWKAWMTSSK